MHKAAAADAFRTGQDSPSAYTLLARSSQGRIGVRKILAVLTIALGMLFTPATAGAGEYDIWFRLHPPANARADLRGYWLDHNSQYLFPPDSGFARASRPMTLAPGKHIDRYGSPNGVYLAPAGTPYDARAVPYDRTKMEYRRYRVMKPLAVKAGPIAAWFDQRGGGIQYVTAKPVRVLVEEGYLRQVR